MSSDIYIPLWLPLSQPGHFEFRTELNVDVDTARHEAALIEPDWDWVKECLEPVLMCKFGARETWRVVEVYKEESTDTVQLHVCCSGDFRWWLCEWLDDHNYQYTII